MNEFSDNGEGVSDPLTIAGTYYRVRNHQLITPIPVNPCGWLETQDGQIMNMQDGSLFSLNCGTCDSANNVQMQNGSAFKFQNGDCFLTNP